MKNNYRRVTTCTTCKYVFTYTDYDEGYSYYCNFNNDRPPCGSCSMDESFTYENKEIREDSEIIKLMEIWDTWQELHVVNSNGICDNFININEGINNADSN